MIIFDYRTTLRLSQAYHQFLANKLNVADRFHAFLPLKVDLNPANIEAEA